MLRLNPTTGKLDDIGDEYSGTLYINATTYFKFEGGQLNLYVNGSLEESWQYTPAVTGNPMGLLLSLTYQL